ncbi:hypothetical protein QQS21_000468 [Conoideocrella luteorostrata]|uniref:Major facilitator superfamily (MFS) profile domain-containing protein n=1 Tax=Conoideocrella luteorostrata TaxID=1105319 RepID=A0AAJ0CZU9_9HYPO|nr:hypothetical protein QQS21_000468 [Conoideocrella luteorostrata]
MFFKQDYATKPIGFNWRSGKWFIVFTVSVALWTDLFLYGIIVPILPFLLEERLNLPKGHIQSYVSGLLAAFAAASFIFSPVTGFLADRLSTRQAPFLVGLLALLGSTTLLLVGRALPVLFIARILQGVSGAFVWTIGLVLCVETVGTDSLGQTMGSIFGWIAIGNMLAPPIGGILYNMAGHQGVFGIAFAILSFDFVLRAFVIEPRVAAKYNGVSSTLDGDHNTATRQRNDGMQNEAEIVDEASPLLHESTSTDDGKRTSQLLPNLPKICHKISILSCLADRRLIAALFLTFVQAMLLGSFDATIPTVAQEYYGLSPLAAGLLFLPLGLSNLALGPVFGRCVDKFGTKLVLVFGYLYLVLCLSLLQLPQPGGLSKTLIYGTLLAFCGMGLASINSAPIVEASRIVDEYYDSDQKFYEYRKPYAQLYGLNNMAFSAGLTLGPELAGELKKLIGYGNMNVVLAVICLLAALLSWKCIGGGFDEIQVTND